MLDPRKFSLQVVKRVPLPFDDEDWLFEIKYDGFRVRAIRERKSRSPIYAKRLRHQQPASVDLRGISGRPG